MHDKNFLTIDLQLDKFLWSKKKLWRKKYTLLLRIIELNVACFVLHKCSRSRDSGTFAQNENQLVVPVSIRRSIQEKCEYKRRMWAADFKSLNIRYRFM